MIDDLVGHEDSLGSVFNYHVSLFSDPGRPNQATLFLHDHMRGYKIEYKFVRDGGQYIPSVQSSSGVDSSLVGKLLTCYEIGGLLRSYQGDYDDFRDLVLEAIDYVRRLRGESLEDKADVRVHKGSKKRRGSAKSSKRCSGEFT